MGRSSWWVFVPYAGDLTQALETAWRQVFERRQYVDPLAASIAFLQPMNDDHPPPDYAIFEREERMMRAAAGLPIGHSPSEWIAILRREQQDYRLFQLVAGPVGTHSVLDIDAIGQRSDDEGAYPLLDEDLEFLFDTVEPDHATVERNAHRIIDFTVGVNDGWYAVYILVYAAGEPSEVAFIGCSGD